MIRVNVSIYVFPAVIQSSNLILPEGIQTVGLASPVNIYSH